MLIIVCLKFISLWLYVFMWKLLWTFKYSICRYENCVFWSFYLYGIYSYSLSYYYTKIFIKIKKHMQILTCNKCIRIYTNTAALLNTFRQNLKHIFWINFDLILRIIFPLNNYPVVSSYYWLQQATIIREWLQWPSILLLHMLLRWTTWLLSYQETHKR